MTIILDGKKLRDKIIEELKVKVADMHRKPTLAVILVGDDPASKLYVGSKEKTAKDIGINSVMVNYPSNVPEKTLLNEISKLNRDNYINAILVQLPLPKHIDKDRIKEVLVSKGYEGHFVVTVIYRLGADMTFLPVGTMWGCERMYLDKGEIRAFVHDDLPQNLYIYSGGKLETLSGGDLEELAAHVAR